MNRPSSPVDSGIPSRYRLQRRLKDSVPLIVWALAAISAVTLYVHQEQGPVVTGIAAEVSYSVAPLTTGRLHSLEVSLHQDVSSGQIVASLDDEALMLRLQEAKAELQRLRFDLEREGALWLLDSAGQQNDQQDDLRRFALDVENSHIAYLEGRASLAENQIQLQQLELTLGRVAELHASELTTLASLQEDSLAYEALRARVAEQRPWVEKLEQRYRVADARYREFRSEKAIELPETTLLLKPLEYAVKVQAARIEQVNLAISNLMLRAPVNGRIAAIYRRPSEVVAGGETVVTILEPRASEVVAYVPEAKMLAIEPGQSVRLRRRADRSQVFRAQVAAVGQRLEQLPARLEPAAVIPSWGLAVHISLPASAQARPGEAFEVAF